MLEIPFMTRSGFVGIDGVEYTSRQDQIRANEEYMDTHYPFVAADGTHYETFEDMQNCLNNPQQYNPQFNQPIVVNFPTGGGI
jgi:hypothetical protein